jgi:hypothetical protein
MAARRSSLRRRLADNPVEYSKYTYSQNIYLCQPGLSRSDTIPLFCTLVSWKPGGCQEFVSQMHRRT